MGQLKLNISIGSSRPITASDIDPRHANATSLSRENEGKLAKLLALSLVAVDACVILLSGSIQLLKL